MVRHITIHGDECEWKKRYIIMPLSCQIFQKNLFVCILGCCQSGVLPQELYTQLSDHLIRIFLTLGPVPCIVHFHTSGAMLNHFPHSPGHLLNSECSTIHTELKHVSSEKQPPWWEGKSDSLHASVIVVLESQRFTASPYLVLSVSQCVDTRETGLSRVF